ncbi:restriction endonuclease subunit S [Phocaeicola salanitronis]|uniref:restriction endonuclease subunit S n=1 Tax=Phocaeicola salanitronis TaxID=376805 RepID=UPI0025A38D70|nr:restriction endonuclease subunit S [Phocaeicola salanitronis]MDM8305669.1 restriction endonuclease subunit S [Phocaeicola salanitronis]
MADNKDKKVLNVPALRFPEFTGEWKEERLDEIAELSKGVGISKEQLSEDGEPCILYGELYTKYKSEIINEVISKTNIEASKLKRSKKNDVIIPCSGETAIDIAVARCIPFGDILLGGDLNVISLHKDNSAFIAYQLNGKRKTDIAKLAQGVSVVHLYGENLKTIKTYNPCLQEQQKIVRLLSILDERISTQNKIIEDLRLLRDAIMVEHYRKCNKSELYIYDIGEPFNVMNLSKDDLTKDGSPCIIYGELFTTYGCVIENVVSHTTESPNSTLSTKGDLLFPASTTVDALSLIAPSSINEDGIILGGDMFGIHVNEQYNSNYLSYYFNIIGKKNLAKYAKGSTIIHLHYADIQKAKITLPNKNEQETVANLLLKVEHKLNIEQKMLINYLNTKNFLLRQMFI